MIMVERGAASSPTRPQSISMSAHSSCRSSTHLPSLPSLRIHELVLIDKPWIIWALQVSREFCFLRFSDLILYSASVLAFPTAGSCSLLPF